MSKVQDLLDQIDGLQQIIGTDTPTSVKLKNSLNLPGRKTPIALGILLTRQFVSRDQMFTALYAGVPDHKQALDKTMDAYICRLRGALRDRGIVIRTVHGDGWTMPEESKAKLRALIDPVARKAVSDRRMAFLEGT